MGKERAKRLSATEEQLTELQKKVKEVRKKVLEMTAAAGAGHIASSFSCTETLVAIYYSGFLKFNPKNNEWKDRDRFVLSKGHAAPALYVILADQGFFPSYELNHFIKDGGRLGCHSENLIPGVEAYTGSLGHGLSIGAGLAFGIKLNKKKNLSIVLLGDGECHEGSVWEAAMFAAQHKLDNLVAIVDRNGLSATEVLRDYLDVEPLKKKWESFGWESIVVDGHSLDDIISALKIVAKRNLRKPLAIIALTTKGKGVSFMENKPIWHYRVPKGKELEIARKELEK